MKGPSSIREDAQIWAVVAATVRPLPGRSGTVPEVAPRGGITTISPIHGAGALGAPPFRTRAGEVQRPAPRPPSHAAEPIEPNRRRRLDLGREPMAGTLDLHGLGREAAREALVGFITVSRARGDRAVLVITGKGLRGDGLLRRQVPGWLAEPPLRGLVAGLSEAHPKRGGAGAFYVVLRRQRS